MKHRSLLAILLLALTSCGSDSESASEPEGEPTISKEEAALRTQDGKDDLAEDLCKINGWYDDGVCDWFCLGGDSDCNAEPLGPHPQGQPTKYPIVLVHGFMASRTSGGSGMLKALKVMRDTDLHVVFFAETPPFNTTHKRAEFIEKYVSELLEEIGAEKVNLIAHSMGGLDSRYLVSENGLGRSDLVASLTTLGTPHRGTKLADFADGSLPKSWDAVLDALVELYGKQFSKRADGNTDFRGALSSLSEKNAPEFNRTHRDSPEVYYQSYAGISSITGIANSIAEFTCDGKVLSHEGTYARTGKLFWPIVPLIAEVGFAETEPNDGLILVRSAKWGNFRGCIPSDHITMSGDGDPEPDEHTGFFATRLLRQIAYDLSDRGF